MSVLLQILADLKHFLKEDAALDLNEPKTTILPKGIGQQSAFDPSACGKCQTPFGVTFDYITKDAAFYTST